MPKFTENLGLKTYEFNVDSTQDFVNGTAGHTGSQDSNMHIIDEVIGGALVDFHNKKHSNLSDRLTEDFGLVHNELSNMGLVSFDKEGLVGNSKKGITRDMVVGGKTLHNLINDTNVVATKTTSQTGIIYKSIKVKCIKPSTKYTLVMNVTKNTTTGNAGTWGIYLDGATLGGDNISPSSTSINRIGGFKGVTSLVFTSEPVITNNPMIAIGMHVDYPAPYDMEIRDFILLEGDWSNKELPEYFSGLQSVGERDNEIGVKSVGKNLFDFIQYGTSSSVIPNIVELNKKYTFSSMIDNKSDLESRCRLEFKHYDGTSTYVGAVCNPNQKNLVSQTFTITKPYKTLIYLGLQYFGYNPIGKATITDIQLEESPSNTTYEPYIEDKKTVILDEPLRSLPNGVRDEIVDGKLIRRVGKRVLHGSEPWTVRHTKENVIAFNYQGDKTLNSFKDYVSSDVKMRCDRFICKSADGEDVEYVMGRANGDGFIISINKNLLSTQDVDGFKKRLKEYPVTACYELETPVTTDLTKDMNVKTYNGSTHIISDNSPIKADLAFKATVDVSGTIKDLISASSDLESQDKMIEEKMDNELTSLQKSINTLSELTVKLGLLKQ